jgi:hypothetical protein
MFVFGLLAAPPPLAHLIIVLLAIPVLGLAYGFLTTDSLNGTPLPGVARSAPPQALADQVRTETPGDQRPEESTDLTYPEWAIVYAARECAGFAKNDRESQFPYWAVLPALARQARLEHVYDY